MFDYEEIMKKGTFIDGGKHRDVFRYEGSIFKVADLYPEVNIKEFAHYLRYKNIEYYNPILNISFDNKVIEVDECLPLYDLIIKENNYNENDNTSRYLKYDLLEDEDDDIFTICNKYHIEKYLYFSKEDIKELCDKNKLDYYEAVYPLNWGYNIRLKKLVLLDYAD